MNDLAAPLAPLASESTPPPAPLAMPTQDLRRAPRPRRRRSARPVTRLARILTFGGALALTLGAGRAMHGAVAGGGLSLIEGVFLALFAATFGWIALAATSALSGALLPPPARPAPQEAGAGAEATAIIMPVYNESAHETLARLQVMATDLARSASRPPIEFFILSDTRDPAIALEERMLVQELRERLARLPGPPLQVWYRRRKENAARKAGNVREFVEGWGGRYAYMLVLDADSLMAGETVLEMIRRMRAAPDLGLLQTAPRLIGGQTLFARLQQFASAAYGAVAARGVAAWQGEDGNFWGHNALIRIQAFAESAGLPTLPGRPPFGGTILSHDFVEAALLRRAGWAVRMDPDLEASWEESPPSVATSLARDRRWAQGNLQHLRIIGAPGFAWPNRAHFAIGVAAYLMSPLWLALLLCGFLTLLLGDAESAAVEAAEAVEAVDPERMLLLLGAAALLLLTPKLIGVARALLDRRGRRAHGGGLRLPASALIELIASILLAPLFMVGHSRHVATILLGRDGGWSPQTRAGEAMAWRDALRLHALDMALGALFLAGALSLSGAFALWLAPVYGPLLLAPALSRVSSGAGLAAWLRRRGLLLIEEERRPPAIVADLGAARAEYRRRAESMRPLYRLDHAWPPRPGARRSLAA